MRKVGNEYIRQKKIIKIKKLTNKKNYGIMLNVKENVIVSADKFTSSVLTVLLESETFFYEV